MSSIFSKIIAGEIPSYKIAENDKFYAFLDIRPMVKGHTLVVPKLEVDRFFDLPADVLEGIMPFCQTVSAALESVVACNRVGLTVMGLEVPHAHVHLMPMNSMREMSFEKSPLTLSPEELSALAKSINTAWESACTP